MAVIVTDVLLVSQPTVKVKVNKV